MTLSPLPMFPDGDVESFHVEDEYACRTVTRRDGSTLTSRVRAPGRLLTGDARNAHDLAWLTGTTRPIDGLRPASAVTIADIFSGCGGLSVGAGEAARALGMDAVDVLAVDTNASALRVFAENFPTAETRCASIEDFIDGELGARPTRRERRLLGDLQGLTLALGGPPCQGHSDLNNHTRRRDPKNALYLRMARFVEVVRPEYALIENVPGVANDRSGVVCSAVAALKAAGYAVETGVVNASAIGAAQARRRHLLLASRTREVPTVEDIAGLHAVDEQRSVLWAIGDLLDKHGGDVFNGSARHSATNEARMRYLFEHDLYDLPDAQRPDCHRLKQHSYTAVYGRMHADRPAPTITRGFLSTGQGRFVHPMRPRTLTPHEAARLQGFPDFFDFSAAGNRTSLAHMIGNAVPSRLAYCAVLELLR